MFTMRVSVNQALISMLRQLPMRMQRNLRSNIQQLKPELQEYTDALLEQGPLPVSSPFVFGSDNSRRFYFWMIRHGEIPTDGAHYERQDLIEDSFEVQISDRLRANLILIRNLRPEAKYVLGPWQVRGHANTGWGEYTLAAHNLIREKAIQRIVEVAQAVLKEALKE